MEDVSYCSFILLCALTAAVDNIDDTTGSWESCFGNVLGNLERRERRNFGGQPRASMYEGEKGGGKIARKDAL